MVENKDSEELQAHLKTLSTFSLDTSIPFDGTIIRIPLRTKAQATESKIVQKEVTIYHIKEALALLGKEVRQGGLLFLKHVRKMTVRVDDTIMWEVHMQERDLGHRRSAFEAEMNCLALLTCNSVRTELTADFKSLYVHGAVNGDLHRLSKSFTLDMSYQEGAETVSTPYLLHHLMQKSSGDEDLDEWARSKKLFPWVAIGAPLKVSLSSQLRHILYTHAPGIMRYQSGTFPCLKIWQTDEELRRCSLVTLGEIYAFMDIQS